MIQSNRTYEVTFESGKVMSISGSFLESILRSGECKISSWTAI